jgi:hypothetical protein
MLYDLNCKTLAMPDTDSISNGCHLICDLVLIQVDLIPGFES